MSEVDYIIPAIRVSQEGVFNLSDLYKQLQSWFNRNKYSVTEKEYFDKMEKDGTRSPIIKWDAYRKADDYTKMHLDLRIKCKNLKSKNLEKETVFKGKVTVKLSAYLEKDYDDRWEQSFMLKFLRGFYDTFVIKGKLDTYAEEAKNDAYDAYNQVKSFLRLEQYKA